LEISGSGFEDTRFNIGDCEGPGYMSKLLWEFRKECEAQSTWLRRWETIGFGHFWLFNLARMLPLV
jgi:hypothetical protein